MLIKQHDYCPGVGTIKCAVSWKQCQRDVANFTGICSWLNHWIEGMSTWAAACELNIYSVSHLQSCARVFGSISNKPHNYNHNHMWTAQDLHIWIPYLHDQRRSATWTAIAGLPKLSETLSVKLICVFCCPHNILLQWFIQNSWKLKTSQLLHRLHIHSWLCSCLPPVSFPSAPVHHCVHHLCWTSKCHTNTQNEFGLEGQKMSENNELCPFVFFQNATIIQLTIITSLSNE